MADHRTQKLTIERVTIPGFADRSMVKMRWWNFNQLAWTATSGPKAQTFELNGAYQPGSAYSDTSTPSYWAKYAAAYAFYRVHRSRITVLVDANVTSSQGDFACLLAPSNLASAPATQTLMAQHPWVKEWQISGNAVSSYQPEAVSTVVKPNVLLGMKKSEYMGDSATRAAVNALPSLACFWYLQVAPTTTTTATVDIKVFIEYDVEFFQRLSLTDTTYLARMVALSAPKLAEKRKLPEEDPLVSEGKLLLSEGKYGSMDGLLNEENEFIDLKSAHPSVPVLLQKTSGSGGLYAAKFWGSAAKTPLGANKG